ncbi:hypothetical protein SKAU_G00263770 [Synaphobranchus kaupii]|uniref:Uncharacterized protein n=1 Tax=Synaphobranchus kaupii TaxID=118154 RepID=A0A9Q1IMT4_SYNKA|nr:hypothetical protein SKAU_G00263770 [Synaphobranchus kaupii]
MHPPLEQKRLFCRDVTFFKQDYKSASVSFFPSTVNSAGFAIIWQYLRARYPFCLRHFNIFYTNLEYLLLKKKKNWVEFICLVFTTKHQPLF